jgi:hypothetical protein
LILSIQPNAHRDSAAIQIETSLETGDWLVGDEITIHIEFELMAAAQELVATTP